MHLLLVSVQAHTSENETSCNKILHTSFSLSFHTYFLVQRSMTQATTKANAFNYYIFQRLTFIVAIESEYLFSVSVKRLDATQFRGRSRSFSLGGSKLWFGKDCWTFCGKSLLKETITCFSICERRSPLARERLLCEQGEQIIGG